MKRATIPYPRAIFTKWIPVILVVLLIFPALEKSIGSGQGQLPKIVTGDDSLVRIHSILIIGNKVTRDRVILREMTVLPGEVLPMDQLIFRLARSRENLLNTSLFNFVEISLEEKSSSELVIRVKVTERWYVWPIPIVKLGDRNFNVWWETKDFSRLSYGFYIDWRNFRGRRENLVTRFQFGYDQLYDFQYLVPYLNKKQTIGIGFGGGFHGNHETTYNSADNKQQFYQSQSDYARKDFFGFVQLQLRRNIYNTHLFELRYDHHAFDDSLIILNPDYSVNERTELGYITLHYKYKSDHRDFAPYPLDGYYFDVEAYQYGLGIEGNDVPGVFYVLSTFRKFWQFSPRVFYAAGLNCKFSSDKEQPYFLIKALGYGRDFVRSYEYYVVDGNNFGIVKSNLKFALVKQRKGEFDFIRTEKFGKFHCALYANLFLDMGYADNPYGIKELGNTLQNEFLLGFGAGIDFVTYYDIVLRFEYSVNKVWEHGFFIHFNAPI